MKKFLALVLALLMALSCFSFAGAEGEGQTLPDGSTQCTSENKVHDIEWTVETPATCKDQGLEKGECKVCHEKFTRVIPVTEKHTFVEVNGTTVKDQKAATCTEDGFIIYHKCSVCGRTDIKVVVPATGHNWQREPKNDVNATCTTDGALAYKCVNPGCKETKTETVKALGHFWYKMDWEYTDATLKTIKYVDAVPQGSFVLVNGEKVINKHNDPDNPIDPYYVAPTCTTEGKSGHAAVCSLCGNYYNGTDPMFMDGQVIPKLTHDKAFIDMYVADYDADKNTCTAGTYTVDGKVVVGTVEIAKANGYGPIEYTYQPQTCEKDGFVKLVCKACNWEKTITIPKTGHQYVGLHIRYVDPDMNVRDMVFYPAPGFQVKVVDWENFLQDVAESITTPEDKEQFLQMAKDQWMQFVGENFPNDCTEAPIVEYICRNPGCENERVNAAGWSHDEHDFGEVLAYRQQKVNEQKVMEYPVAEVGETEDWEADYEANRAAAFENISICTDYTVVKRCWRCAQTTEIKVAGKGHKLTEDLAILEKETCSKTGLKAVKCVYCPYNEIQTILPHKPEADPAKDKITKNATCTQPGEMSHVCKKCGESFTTVIPAAGHNWQTKVLVVATCDKPGKIDIVCTACGEHKPGYPMVVPNSHEVDETRPIAAENMTYSIKDGKLTAEVVDCTKPAKLSYYCKKCKLVVIEPKLYTEHNWEKVSTVPLAKEPFTKKDDATCLQNFEVTYKCTRCKQTKTVVESEMIKHVWATGDSNGMFNGKPVYIEPTATQSKCGQVGEAYYLCEHCGQYYKAASLPVEHDWVTTWDAKNKAWTYTCRLCGVEKTAVLEAPQYNVSLKGVTFGPKTTGMGQITLKNDTAATWILSTKYAYIRWTFKDGAGEDWVFDDVRPIDDNGYFNANGIKAPAGATLHEFLVIITDDANADSKMLNQIKRYGHATK